MAFERVQETICDPLFVVDVEEQEIGYLLLQARLLVHSTREMRRCFFASNLLEQRHFSEAFNVPGFQDFVNKTIREVSIPGGSGNITAAEVALPICYIVPLLVSILQIQLVQSKGWALFRNRGQIVFVS